MGDVVDLEEHREVWLTGLGLCGVCGAVWVGTCHHLRTHGLECPRCGLMAGLVLPMDSDEIASWLDGFDETEPTRLHLGPDDATSFRADAAGTAQAEEHER